jgi:hypothetical protein
VRRSVKGKGKVHVHVHVHVQAMSRSKYKVRVAAAGRRQARLSLSRSMMAGGRGHTWHMAHGTAHGTWETVDGRQSTGVITDYTVHRTSPLPLPSLQPSPLPSIVGGQRERERGRLLHPVLCFATRGRSGRLGTCTGCSFQAEVALCCPAAAACRLLPAALPPTTCPVGLASLPPPRLQPEETEAEDETRHVVSLQPPAHGDKRSTAPHRTEQTTEGRQHPTAPPRATNGVAVVIPMPAIDDRPVAHRAAIGTVWNPVVCLCPLAQPPQIFDPKRDPLALSQRHRPLRLAAPALLPNPPNPPNLPSLPPCHPTKPLAPYQTLTTPTTLTTLTAAAAAPTTATQSLCHGRPRRAAFPQGYH